MTKTLFVVTPRNRYSIFADMDEGFVSMMYASPTGAPYGQEFVMYPDENHTIEQLLNDVAGRPDAYAVAHYA